MRVPAWVETRLRTAAGVLILPAALALASARCTLLALFGASAERVHRLYVGFARLGVRIGGTRLEVRGAERIEPGRGYVVVTNHESAWDPVCVVAGLPGVILRFIVKQELMKIPVFGHALRLTGNVMVARTQTRDDVDRIRGGMESREPSTSLLFFAEGTRSRDGAFQSFKMGPFATAIVSELPILPIALAGPYAIWPKGTLRLRRRPVVIEVGAPLPTAGLKLEDRAELRDRTHEIVGALRARARARLRALGHEPGGID